MSDVPSAPLFVDAVCIFVACAVEFEVGVLAPEDFSVSNLPLRGFTVGVLVFAILFHLHEKLIEIHRYCDSKHCFADAEGTSSSSILWLLMGNRFHSNVA